MHSEKLQKNVDEAYRLAGLMRAESHVVKEDGGYDLVPVFVGLIKDGVELREVRNEEFKKELV